MNKLIMMIGAAVCLALGAYADTAATYTAGVPSLAGGKITFEYDGSDNITKMRMKPDYGETLTLSGDTLSFADGAQVITSQQGTPVIANAVSAAGSLRLGGVTNMTWSGTDIDQYNNPGWHTVLTNVRLEDIVPVPSAQSATITYHPYWIVRDGNTLRAEYQTIDDGNFIKAVHLELMQDGNDIKAQVINGGYSSVEGCKAHLGESLFEHPTYSITTNNNTAKKQKLSKLTFARRYDTFDYCGNFISNTFDTVVATDVKLDDIEIISAGNYTDAHGWHTHSGTNMFFPRNVKLSNGVLSARFAFIDSPYVKAVKLEMMQSGNDILARVAWARYATTNDTIGVDFDFDNAESSEYSAATVASSFINLTTGLKYGLDTLILRSKAKDKLTFAVSDTMSLGAVSGENAEVTFEAASATATVNATGANAMTDSAYVIKGDAEHVMSFNVSNKDALPAGTTDAWGEGTILNLAASGGMGGGVSGGNSVITMHSGSKITTGTTHVFKRTSQIVDLDAAQIVANNVTYVPKTLTLANGSTVSGSATLSAVYDQSGVVMNVTGTGESTFGANVALYGNDTSKRWTIDVEDTVAGDGVDFIMNGNIAPDATYNMASISKTGTGTMLMNGTMSYVVSATEVVEGELLLGKSGATAAGSLFSLEGGTLGLAANTANTVSSVAVTADSAISFGAGATLTVTTLTLGNEVNTFSITGADGEYPIRISNRLDAETLAKIRLNGKRVTQAGDGRLVRPGLIISIF